MKILEADSSILKQASRGSNYTIDAKNINELSKINPVDFRLKYAKELVDSVLPSFSKSGWGDVKVSNPDYSNFTTTTVKGDKATQLAVDLMDLAKAGKISMTDDSDEFSKSYRFGLADLEDAQIFFDEGDGKDTEDTVTLVVRPLEIDQEVTIKV